MSRFDSLLFDFDGVLVDSEPVHWACWSEVLKPLGVDLNWKFYSESCIGIDDREMLRMMATCSDPPRNWEDLWAQYPAKKQLFRGRMLAEPPFPPSLRPLLEEMRPDYRMAVVSSSGRDEIEPMLEAGSLREFFDVLVCARDVERLKPAPDPYLKAAALLNAQQPLVIEDSPAGLAAGRAAGFEVLAVCNPADVPGLVRARLAGCSTAR